MIVGTSNDMLDIPQLASATCSSRHITLIFRHEYEDYTIYSITPHASIKLVAPGTPPGLLFVPVTVYSTDRYSVLKGRRIKHIVYMYYKMTVQRIYRSVTDDDRDSALQCQPGIMDFGTGQRVYRNDIKNAASQHWGVTPDIKWR